MDIPEPSEADNFFDCSKEGNTNDGFVAWVILGDTFVLRWGIDEHEKLRVVPGCGHSMLSAVGTSNHCRISLLTGPPSQRPSDSESSTEPRSVH